MVYVKIKFALFDQFGQAPAYEMVLMKTAVVKGLPNKLFELRPIYYTLQPASTHSSCSHPAFGFLVVVAVLQVSSHEQE